MQGGGADGRKEREGKEGRKRCWSQSSPGMVDRGDQDLRMDNWNRLCHELSLLPLAPQSSTPLSSLRVPMGHRLNYSKLFDGLDLSLAGSRRCSACGLTEDTGNLRFIICLLPVSEKRMGWLAWDPGLYGPSLLPAPAVLCFLQKAICNTRIIR